MHRADKAVLRLATGLGLAAVIAYGLAMQLAFIVCVVPVLELTKPGPPAPFMKGVVSALVVAGLLAAGLLMVPLLEHYTVAGLVLTGAVLFVLFFNGARKGSPMTLILAIAFTVIPVAGYASQALATAVAQAFGTGLAIGVVVNAIAHALFPDPPMPAKSAAAPAGAGPESARWQGLQATVVVMPAFVVALTNPTLYVPILMKSLTLGQQVGATGARSAGLVLVGSTVMGALVAALVWAGLSLLPNLWMLTLLIVAVALWVGARIFGVRPTSLAPAFWVNVLVTMFIVLGPAIEDAAVGKDVYLASFTRVCLLIAVSLYAWATVWLLGQWRAARAARSLKPASVA
jgi:hypothetical protein